MKLIVYDSRAQSWARLLFLESCILHNNNDDNTDPKASACELPSKLHKKRASCSLQTSSIKKTNSREIKRVREGQLLYNRSLARQARQNKEKEKKDRPTFDEPPTKLTDTYAYFNYLEHQLEQCHKETVAQRTQDYNRVSSAARRSMTPEKIKWLRLQRREEQEAIRAKKQEKRDKERREEEERLQKKLEETAPARKQTEILWRKHFDPRHGD
jgi:hypothetical protein